MIEMTIFQIILILYALGFVVSFIVGFYAMSHIGVYWYQFNRIKNLRTWGMIIVWPLSPILIYLHEREINKYFSLSFENRMRVDGRYAVQYKDSRGECIGYALPDKDGMIKTMNGFKHYTEWKDNTEVH
jgi:hypothetical protein